MLFSADDDRRGLLSAGSADYHDDGDAVIEMDLLPPRWADITDEVTEILADVARKSQKLERLHQQHVLPGFDDEHTKRAEERDIETLTQDITKGFHDCHRCIQRIEKMVREQKDAGTMTRAEEVMAKNIQVSLATRVQEASAGFRKKQSTYLKSMLPRLAIPITPYAFDCGSSIDTCQNSVASKTLPCPLTRIGLALLSGPPAIPAISPSSNPKPTSHSLSPRSSPHSDKNSFTKMMPPLFSASGRLKILRRVSSTLVICSATYRQWSSTRGLCSIVLTITWSEWRQTCRPQRRSSRSQAGIKSGRQRGK